MSALPQRSTELLKTCENELTRHLLTYIRPAFEETNDELFDEAHKSGSNQEQNRLFEAMNALKNKRTAFSESLTAEIANGFEAFVAGETDPDTEPVAPSAGELSLVEDQDLIEDLAITQIVSKAEIRNTQALYALNQRLAVLNRGRAVKNHTNPCGPFKIGAVLRNAATCLDMRASDKVRLFHAFDRQLTQQIGEIYSELNQKLIDEGILPNLKMDVRRSSAPPPPATPPADEGPAPGEPESDPWPTEQPAGANPPPAGGQTAAYQPPPERMPPAGGASPLDAVPPAPAPAPDLDFFGRATSRSIGTTAGSRVDAELVRDIRKMLRQVTPQTPVPRDVVIAETNRLQQALSGLQTRLAQQADELPDLLSAQQVKGLLSESLGQDESSGHNLALSDTHSQTIDIVGMLYEHIKEEELLHEPVQQLLKRLQVPMIRVALEEEEFFDDTEHPARRLFNTIADAGELWLDDRPEGSDTFEKMQIAVDRILTEYQDDLDVFKELLGDLDKHISTLSRKAKVTERRAVEKLRGQEKLELARDRARSEMERLIEKYEPPRFVESMLEHPWTDFLALTSLRHGIEDEHWKEALATAKTLIFSVRKGLSEEVKAKLRKRIPWLRDKLRDGLSQVGYFEQDIDIVLGNLETCHRWSLAETGEARVKREKPAPEAPVAPRAEREEAKAAPEEAERPAAAKRKAAPEAPVAPRAELEEAEAAPEAPVAPRAEREDAEAAPEEAERPAAAKRKATPAVEAPAAEDAPPWLGEEETKPPAAPPVTAGTDAEWEKVDLKKIALEELAEKERAAARSKVEPTEPVAEAVPEPEVLNTPIPKSAAHKATHAESMKKRKAALPKLNSAQKGMLAKIRLLAFGTWFELNLEGQEAPWVKRKLSWYSPLTGRCLFVNNRGAMAEELNMHELAIAMADGRARIYEPNSKPLIDRAFQSIFKRLRGLVDRVAPA